MAKKTKIKTEKIAVNTTGEKDIIQEKNTSDKNSIFIKKANWLLMFLKQIQISWF